MDMKEICGHLKNDGVIVYPTDTLYALGALAFHHEKAITKLFELKKMQSRVLSVAFPDFATARKYADVSQEFSHIFPAPLTVIAHSFSRWNHVTLHDKMAVRIPANETALELLRECGPLTATSANIHNGPNLTLKEIKETFGDEVLIVEGEEPKYMQPSTIVDVVEGKVVRAGAYPVHEIPRYAQKRALSPFLPPLDDMLGH